MEGLDLRRSIHMVPNELDVSPEAMNLIAAFAATALSILAARFFLWLRELEGYARGEGL